MGDDHLLFSQIWILWTENIFFLKFAFFSRENTNPSNKSGTGTKNNWIITEKVI